jgi:tRNA nucleotidyltransferase (CCA-adding enzyme)
LRPTREAAFEQAALALTGRFVIPIVRSIDRIEVDCERRTMRMLLVAWLNALIYEMATRRMLFGHYQVHIADGRNLRAEAWGESVDIPRHRPAVEPKGATVTELRVAETSPGNWLAQCVVDV